MPLYTYKCTECSHEFETFVLSAADKETPQKCPDCGAKASEPLQTACFRSASRDLPSGPSCSNFG